MRKWQREIVATVPLAKTAVVTSISDLSRLKLPEGVPLFVVMSRERAKLSYRWLPAVVERLGTPQGGGVSPILSNIYMDRLDKFVEKVLIPAHTKGEARRTNPQWKAVQARVRYHNKQGHRAVAHSLRKEMQRLPSGDPFDPGYRRLHYIRYADDFLLGFTGSTAEAEDIKRQLSEFLQDTLKLELSEDKTLITHATSNAARFLGYEIVNQQADDKHDRNGRRKVNGRIGLRVPADVTERHCRLYMRNGKPAHRNEMLHDDDYTIVSRYQAEFRGVVQYYLPALNVSHLGKLRWVMQQSLAKTLAAKHKTPRRKLIRKYQAKVETAHGELACLRVTVERGEGKRPLVAQFGGIPLRRRKDAILVDQTPLMRRTERNELIKRLLADACEMCGSTEQVQVHHIRKLKDLTKKGRGEAPLWVQTMAARRRKTLVVCRGCHVQIHNGRLANVVPK